MKRKIKRLVAELQSGYKKFNNLLTNAVKVHHIVRLSPTIFIFVTTAPPVAFVLRCLSIFAVIFPAETLGAILETEIRESLLTDCALAHAEFLGNSFHAQSCRQVM